MKTSNKSDKSQSLFETAAPFPIEEFLCYEWEKEDSMGSKVPKALRQQRRWNGLRELIKSTIDNVKTRAAKTPGLYSLQIRVNRLRGRHGMYVLATLRERIRKADILVIDIGSAEPCSANANTLLELGIAICQGKSESGSLFILKPQELKWPSDLNGIMYTEYDGVGSKDGSPKLLDRLGFDAALRTRILVLARNRNMVGYPKKISVEYDDDESSTH